MPDPVTMILNHGGGSVDPIDELARISFAILKDNGWKIDRLQPQQNLLLVAAPFYTRDEEKIVAARIEAMTAAHKHRIADEYKTMGSMLAVLSAPLLVWGVAGLFTSFYFEAAYVLFAGAVLAFFAFVLRGKGGSRG